ncbi:MAG: metal ABC transporter ATP-binding protein [Patescibacteria group bacterium]|nr:metal ABC transporter ATP-binding protein [Patescibacteria group bacterium]
MRIVDHHKNIIEVKNVSFAYDRQREALKNITLDIHQGDYVGVIGPNGAGKTTLFKIMLGLLKAKTGTVKLFGTAIESFKNWQKIGYVPQETDNFEANFPATVREIVAMGRYRKNNFFNGRRSQDKQAVQRALTQVGLWTEQDRLIGDLSAGQRQRVFIARALVNEPEVIFLDEPTTGVDQETRNNFYSMLKKINEELSITLIIISHDLEQIIKEVMHVVCVDQTLTCHQSTAEYLKASDSTRILGQDVKIITHHHHGANGHLSI